MAVRQTNARSTDNERLAWDLVLDLDGHGPGPLHERLKRALRAAVAAGSIDVGAALPPSRQLATDLGVSRWAVTEAYAQLVAEGYLEARTGSATRVRWAGSRSPDEPRGHLPVEQAPDLDLHVRLGVGVGRQVEAEAAVEGERGAHVGDDELDHGEAEVHAADARAAGADRSWTFRTPAGPAGAG